MGKKRYRSIYDALDDVLMDCIDTQGVKSAKERYEEQKVQQETQSKHFIQMEDVLSGKTEREVRKRKLQAIIDDPAAMPGEKENARRILVKMNVKGDIRT